MRNHATYFLAHLGRFGASIIPVSPRAVSSKADYDQRLRAISMVDEGRGAGNVRDDEAPSCSEINAATITTITHNPRVAQVT